jgi:hypothetical protein
MCFLKNLASLMPHIGFGVKTKSRRRGERNWPYQSSLILETDVISNVPRSAGCGMSSRTRSIGFAKVFIVHIMQ